MSNHPHAPSLPFSSRKPDGADFELDEKWKAQLKKRIEGSFQSMVRDAKDNYQAGIRKGSISAEARTRVEAEYRQEMTTVKELATEQYQYEINRERDQRRLTATMPFIRHNDANPSNDEQASSLASQHKPDTTDFEPDEEWKAQLKKRIEGGLQSMVQDAKARMPDKTKRHITVETRLRLEAEYKQAMTNIKELATEQYQHELNRERDQRRRAATLPSSSDASANANLSGHEQVSSSASSRKPCVADFEPDKEWKAQLKKRIEDALEPMVQYVEERQQAELGKGPFNAEARMRLETEYKQTMNSIKELANGQYLLELNRERDQRRQTAATVSRPPA